MLLTSHHIVFEKMQSGHSNRMPIDNAISIAHAHREEAKYILLA
jgi:hypothetical protein